MRFKSLSFYDYDEDKRNLFDKNHSDSNNLDFDDDEMDESVCEAVDEGAIVVLSVDQIRNMKTLQMQYEQQNMQIEEGNSKVKCQDFSETCTPRTSASGDLLS